MNTKAVLFTFCAFLTPLASAAIYKIVDADGNVSYTDVAPTEEEAKSATTVEMNLVNTFKDPVATQPSTSSSGTDRPSSDTYETLEIVAPADSTSVRANAGNVTVRVRLEPALQPGHHVRFFLDGKPVGTVAATDLTLQNVDRGEHTVAAVVIDSQGNPVQDSRTTRFTLQRVALGSRSSS